MDEYRQEISWEALEYEYEEKSSDWFWVVGGVAFFAIIVSLLFKNILFAIIILIAAFSVAMYAKRPPQYIKFSLSRRGVRVNNTLYPYDHLESFWVEENLPIPKVMLKSERFFLPYVIMPIQGINPDVIHDFLSKHLPEKKHEESIVEVLAEHIGF